MSKLLIIFLLATASLFPQHITGDGSSGNPYVLYNAADFDSIRHLGTSGEYYELGNDINLGIYADFVPFGSNKYIRFDGKGYTIDSLKMVNRAGLFGYYTSDTRWSNTRFANAVLTTSSLPHTSIMGFSHTIAVTSGVLFSRIDVDSLSIVVTTTANNNLGRQVGGIVSVMDDSDSLWQCSVTNSNITVSQSAQTDFTSIGMVVGIRFRSANIVECKAVNNTIIYAGTGTSTSIPWIGGITGRMASNSASPHLKNSYVRGLTVTNNGTTDIQVGGISSTVGASDNSVLDDCYAEDISSNSDSSAIIIYDNDNTTPTSLASSIGDSSTSSMKITQYKGAGAAPTRSNSTSMIDSTIYLSAGWDLEYRYFGDIDTIAIWNQHYSVNNGYPYLHWEHLAPTFADFTITSPLQGELYFLNDPVNITWTSNNTDTVYLYYTDDVGFSWTLLDSIKDNGSSTIAWIPSVGGFYQIKLVDKTTSSEAISGEFEVIVATSITILSPIDSTASLAVGDTINIIIESVNVNAINIYYAIDDTTGGWITIEENIIVDHDRDTTVYAWALPNIFGTLFLRVSNVNDTVKYVFNKDYFQIAGGMPSSPWICWYHNASWIWPTTASSAYFFGRGLDVGCGWVSGLLTRHSSILNDDLATYIYYLDPNYYPAGEWTARGPYSPDAAVGIYTAIDTAFYEIYEIYSNIGDSITYKDRLYFYDPSDSTLRNKDLVNNIDSIFVSDLSGIRPSWTANPKLQIINIQPSKLIGQFHPISLDLETLNDRMFTPVVIAYAGKTNGRGNLSVKIEALNEPPSDEYVYDIARLFTELNMTRNYFRGIHPKAEKR